MGLAGYGRMGFESNIKWQGVAYKERKFCLLFVTIAICALNMLAFCTGREREGSSSTVRFGDLFIIKKRE